MKPVILARLAFLASLTVAGCASSPESAFYTLKPVPGTAVPAATAPASPSVELRRVGLAGYLDRAEIVRGETGYRLNIAGGDRWAEPLGDMIGRVLAEDLNRRMPGSAVVSETGAISAEGDVIVEVEVQRLDSAEGGAVLLQAQVSVRAGRGSERRLTRDFRFTAQPGGADTSALVAAMSALLGQLADATAVLVRELPSAAAT